MNDIASDTLDEDARRRRALRSLFRSAAAYPRSIASLLRQYPDFHANGLVAEQLDGLASMIEALELDVLGETTDPERALGR